MLATPSPSVTPVRPSHPSNAPSPTVLTFPGIVMSVKAVQPANARAPMFVTLAPITTFVSRVKFSNMPSGMFVPSTVMLVRPEHPPNASSPTKVTPSRGGSDSRPPHP